MAKRRQNESVALVIPVRGVEPMLQQTIDSAIEQAGTCAAEIIVVDNGLTQEPPDMRGSGRVIKATIPGTSFARHVGVLAATSSIVVTIDAHMLLGKFWADNLREQFDCSDWARSVCCGMVGHLGADFLPIEGPFYRGAKLNLFDTSDGRRVLPPRWCAANKPGKKIGAIMGAFYVFKRDWYEKIGAPWRLNRSWGCDEEIISLASWLSGGDCRLLPDDLTAWHYFRDKPIIPYAPQERYMQEANRDRLLRLFPFDDGLVAAAGAFLGRPVDMGLSVEDAAFSSLYAGHAEKLGAHLANWCTGYAAWMERGEIEKPEPSAYALDAALAAKIPHARILDRQPPTPATPAPAVDRAMPQALDPLPVDRCDQCDAKDSFRVVKTESRVRRYECTKCGRAAWRPREGASLNFSIRND